MKYKFGNTSLSRLDTCHADLQRIMKMALEISPIDFGIAEGHRSIARQNILFLEGKSKIDGINKLGKHNSMPSMAVDIYLWIDGKAQWKEEDLTYVAGIIHAVAEILYDESVIAYKVRWGGNWDKDGEILSDQSFDDRPHFELYIP